MPETRSRAAVTGDVKPATKEGFAALIANANEAHANGYRLLTIVRLGDGIAAVYQEMPPKTGDSFFDI